MQSSKEPFFLKRKILVSDLELAKDRRFSKNFPGDPAHRCSKEIVTA